MVLYRAGEIPQSFDVMTMTILFFIVYEIIRQELCSFCADAEDPVISGCPEDVSGNTDPGAATGTVSWTEPTATDNSGIQTLTSNYNPGDSFPIGVATVTYTSTDEAGNAASCTFDVLVTGAFSNCLPLLFCGINISQH